MEKPSRPLLVFALLCSLCPCGAAIALEPCAPPAALEPCAPLALKHRGPCGDIDLSGSQDGKDIQQFVDCLILGQPACSDCARIDFSGDGDCDECDVAGFVSALVLMSCSGQCPCTLFNEVWVVNGGNAVANACFPEEPMIVKLNGAVIGRFKLLELFHRAEDGVAFPLIASFASSGFIRARPGAPPGPTLGTSVVLGPAVWKKVDPDCDPRAMSEVLFFNPQLTEIDVDTSGLDVEGAGEIVLRITGFLRDGSGNRGPLDVNYEITIPDPTDSLTSIRVTENFMVSEPFCLPERRLKDHEAFRVVQFSSMFLDDVVHDSDAVRYRNILNDEIIVHFSCLGSLVFGNPLPMGARYLDSIHSDDFGFNGNSPNIRILLDSSLTPEQFTPQGFLSVSTDPNNDNVGLWIHFDATASMFNAGDSGSFTFTVEATDDPSGLVPTPSCTLQGDLNQDGSVRGDDIAGYLRAKLCRPPAPGENQNCADFDTGTLDQDNAAMISALLNGP